jgi:branched-chain amino acid transport system substrate-binding protein
MKRVLRKPTRIRGLVNLSVCGLVLATTVVTGAGRASAVTARAGTGKPYLLGMSMILSGDLRSIGVAIKDGAELATIQRNRGDLARLGITVGLHALDYGANGTYSPAKDARNAHTLLKNPRVFAEDGPYNSGAAEISMPVYNRGDLVQVSPGNTLPDLTYPRNLKKLQPATAAGRHGRTYFRVCTTDAFQGPAGVQFAVRRFHPGTAYVVSDWGLPGIGLAKAYRRALRHHGIRILGRGQLQQSQPATSAVAIASAILQTHPDIVFFGGEPDTGGSIFANALRGADVTAPIIGGDGLFTSSWIVGSNGSYQSGSWHSWMTVIGPNPRISGFASTFRAHFHRAPTPFAVLAYDAANLEIDALVKALREGKGGSLAALREAVRASVQSAHFHGLVGTTRFDRNGDTTDKVIGIWHVTGRTATSFGWLGYAPGYAPRRS